MRVEQSQFEQFTPTLSQQNDTKVIVKLTIFNSDYIFVFNKNLFISEFKKSGKCFSNNFDIIQWQLTQQSNL